MTIADARQICKNLLARVPRDVLIIGILMLASSFSFGLGYLAGRDAGQGSELTLTDPPLATAPTSEVGAPTESVGVVASKNGTKYYLTSCTAANRISPANKVSFASAALAVKAGYAPASNCPGL